MHGRSKFVVKVNERKQWYGILMIKGNRAEGGGVNFFHSMCITVCFTICLCLYLHICVLLQ